MTPISILLAVSAPLLHARVRSVLIADPDMALVHDAVSGTDAARQTAYLTPSIVLCDRQMLADPDFAGMRIRKGCCPLVVLVTVNSEVLRTNTSLTISGTVPFDARPRDMASRLRAVLMAGVAAAEQEAATAAQRPAPSAMLVRLSGRFSVPETSPTFTEPLSLAPLPVIDAPAPTRAYQPMPTKTAQLKRTSFLKSMLDDSDPVLGREKGTLVS
jgi:DNA-binding NarL/FixJ family response regulator